MAQVMSKRRRKGYQAPAPGKSAGAYASNILDSLSNLTEMKNKIAETKLSRSNLLDTTKFQFKDIAPGSPTEDQLVQMFERAPMPESDIPYVGGVFDYIGSSFDPAYKRVQATDVAKANYTPKEMTDNLIDKGFSHREASQVLGDYYQSPKPTVPLDVEVDQFPVEGLDYNIDARKSIPLPKSELTTSLDNLEQTSKISEITGTLKDDVASIGEEVISSADEVLAAEKLTKVTGEAGEAAAKAGQVAGETGSKLGSILGTAGDIFSVGTGAMRMKKGYEEGDAENIIQGGIQAASPLLVAAGPYGWAVLGVSMLEDLLFD